MFRKVLFLVLASSVLSGCGLVTVVDADHSQHGGLPTDSYSMNDLMFAQMMIPHHEQAIQISTWARTRAADPEVKAIAEQILAAQAPEIEQLKSWLGNRSMSDHSMHMSMEGMLSEGELSKLESLTGAEFDKGFLSAMIKHHQGAVQMAKDYLDSSNQEVLDLLNNVIETQNAEIAEMNKLLQSAN